MVFLLFVQIVSAGKLIENRKTGIDSYIDWFSIQLGGGVAFENSDLISGVAVYDISLFNFRWKYGYFSPLIANSFCVWGVPGRCGVEIRGGLGIPVNKNNTFRIGIGTGMDLLIFHTFDITPHFVYLHYFKSNGLHLGFGIDFPVYLLKEKDSFCILGYIKFGL